MLHIKLIFRFLSSDFLLFTAARLCTWYKWRLRMAFYKSQCSLSQLTDDDVLLSGLPCFEDLQDSIRTAYTIIVPDGVTSTWIKLGSFSCSARTSKLDIKPYRFLTFSWFRFVWLSKTETPRNHSADRDRIFLSVSPKWRRDDRFQHDWLIIHQSGLKCLIGILVKDCLKSLPLALVDGNSAELIYFSNQSNKNKLSCPQIQLHGTRWPQTQADAFSW